jgi:hypothetical protein
MKSRKTMNSKTKIDLRMIAARAFAMAAGAVRDRDDVQARELAALALRAMSTPGSKP